MNLDRAAETIGRAIGQKFVPLQNVVATIANAVMSIDDRLKALEDRKPDPVEVSHEDVLAAFKSDPEFMREVVATYLRDNPPPAGPKGDPGDEGPIGPQGDPGFGVAGAFINQCGHLVLTLGNGEAKDVGPVVGADGRDGFSLEDFTAEYDGERGLVLSFADENLKAEHSLHLPITIHRGFWAAGTRAKQGDAWTCDGSLWIAKRDNDTKPSYQNKDDWIMAARKGRDGEQGPPGRDHVTPQPVALNGS
jgi:hypothetical protein